MLFTKFEGSPYHGHKKAPGMIIVQTKALQVVRTLPILARIRPQYICLPANLFSLEQAWQDAMVYSTNPNSNQGILNPIMSLPVSNELEDLRRLDPQTISDIYDRYFPDVYRFVRYRLNDEDLAEDIASDVFVRLLEAARSGRGPQSNLKAWLLATAAHIVIDHLRKSYRRPESSLPETILDGLPGPSTQYEIQERDQHLKNAMSTLTEEQQNVIILRFNLGYSLEETADLMNKNINSVKQLQFRALAALNRVMSEISWQR